MVSSLIVLLLLWFRLIDHLRIEWAVNPQYTYGWAVPFLCLYLWWRGWRGEDHGTIDYETIDHGTIDHGTMDHETVGAVAERPTIEPRKETEDKGRKTSLRSEATALEAEDEGPAFAQRLAPAKQPRKLSGCRTEVGGRKSESGERTPGENVQLSTFDFQLPTGGLIEPPKCRNTVAPKHRHTETPIFGTFPSGFCSLFSVLFWLLAFAYLPTRLIQQANPEWRLVSWALAIEVIGLTLWLVRHGTIDHETMDHGTIDHKVADHPHGLCSRVYGLWSHGLWSRRLWSLFPLLFFLVAVPWPTLIEGPLIEALTRANAATTAELVSLAGMPAIQHGNVIEVSTGVVGIDDACSGIRSFQAALMISLFFGELYRLTAVRRAALCVAGFVFSFLFNLGRTTLLAWVAAKHGTAAIASWHDPAGVLILVGCFVCAWVASLALGDHKTVDHETVDHKTMDHGTMDHKTIDHGTIDHQTMDHKTVDIWSRVYGLWSHGPWSHGLPLLAWVLFSDIATELWYRAHERGLPPPVTWTVELPRENRTLRALPFSEKTRQFLRFDEGLNARWEEGPDRKVQAIFLRWKPGRTAVHLAKTHTPEACVTAGGLDLVSKSDLRLFKAGGLQLPFRSYVFKDPAGPLHVYYCLWEDRGARQVVDSASLTYETRIAPVLAGRRLSGQRSLELALWGLHDGQEADEAAAQEIGRMVRTKF